MAALDIKLLSSIMCQCMLCGCMWCNYCGVCCGGCHQAYCVCSYWVCKPEDLRLIDPECCHLCACDGFGYNCLYYGTIWCAPRAVVQWSGLRAAGKTALDMNKNTIIVNNPTPIYMAQPQEMSYQVTTTTTRNNSNFGMNMGGNMNSGAPGMDVNMNMNPNAPYGYGAMNVNVGSSPAGLGANVGTPGMNAKINF